MAYETLAGVPTKGLAYAQLTEHIRQAQEAAAMLAHLSAAEGSAADRLHAQGWLGVSELLKRLNHQITELAKRGLQ